MALAWKVRRRPTAAGGSAMTSTVPPTRSRVSARCTPLRRRYPERAAALAHLRGLAHRKKMLTLLTATKDIVRSNRGGAD
jgi:hypothetical protein